MRDPETKTADAGKGFASTDDFYSAGVDDWASELKRKYFGSTRRQKRSKDFQRKCGLIAGKWNALAEIKEMDKGVNRG